MRNFIRDIFALKNALLYSINGIKYLIKERAFRQELIAGGILCLIEAFRNTSLETRLYLFSSYILILMLEGVNSAIESIINRIGLEKHELSKKTKDIGSSVVFIAILHFGIIWILSFIRQ